MKTVRPESLDDLDELLSEAAYLLYLWGPSDCLNWKEGIGDCEECGACRVFRCIEALDTEVNEP